MAIELDRQHIQKAEIQLTPSASYSFCGSDSEMKMCLDLRAAGKLNAKRHITHRFASTDINNGFETASDKERNKSIFVPISSLEA